MADDIDSAENISNTGLPREEWLFTGRRAVLARILTWIHTETPGAFVVTGSAGSGKSAVVSRIVTLSESARRRALFAHAPLEPADPDPGLGAVDAAVHLRGMGTDELATALADRLRLPAPENSWQLLEAVATMSYPPVLVFDGLDEAIPEQASKIMTSVLVPLSALASVLVATRCQEFGWSSGQGAVVRLSELFGGKATVVDLDAEPGTEQDIEQYVARSLRHAGRAELGPRVAPVLASRAADQPDGFLYARTLVAQLVRGVLDAEPEDWAGRLPANTIEALEHDLTSRPRVRDGVELPDAARDLLRALAWGMGRGIPGDAVWTTAATAMSPSGVEYHDADLAWVLDHYGCYIGEDHQDGEVVYRLAHREFVEHLLVSAPDVAGRVAGQALAEALIALAETQTGPRGEIDRCSPHLRRHLARYATRGGPPAIVAFRGLAQADPEALLPGLGVALNDFAAYLLAVGRPEAAVIATEHAVETYRALIELDSDAYLPRLADALDVLAARHAELRRHEAALVPAQEAVEIHQRLAETSPDVYFIHLVASLKTLTHQLAALDRISVGVDVYTSCIATFTASPACRDALIIERAGFHINHGDASTGLRELITLLTLDDDQTPGAVALVARNVLRAHRVRDLAAVNRAWRAVTGAEPPDWLALTATQISLVTEWIMAASWTESKAFCAAHARELLDDSATEALDELALAEPTNRVEVHRHLLRQVREHGLDAAYRPMLLRELLMDWIQLTDWADSQAFAEKHAADLLTREAEVALIRLGDPQGTLVNLVLLRLARRDGIASAYACVTDRQQAAARMQRAFAEVDPDPIAELAALEGQIFGERFIGVVHLFVAALLMGEAVTDFTKLVELAEHADPADRQRVADEITDLISRQPEQAGVLAPLPEILLAPAQPGDAPGRP